MLKNNKHQNCIDSCNQCVQSCMECFTACLSEEDVAARKETIGILLDCAKMCELSSCLIASDSKFAMDHCNLCATVCEKCSDACSMFQDEHCQKCADTCNKCSEECRNMANMQE